MRCGPSPRRTGKEREPTSACLYDSGAPYFGVPRLVSVESTGPDRPHSRLETTSRVDVDVRWIRSVVADLP